MPAVGTLKRPRTREEVVALLREAGIVGAGGAGFPTYLKYQRPASLLIANGMESEPGFWADKLLLRDHPEEFAALFRALRELFGFAKIILAVKERYRDWVGELEALSHAEGFEIRYLRDAYGLGAERALIYELTGRRLPPGSYPIDLGIVVNNVETLYNVYRALEEGRPVITKFLTVFGEVAEPKAFEAPVGAYAHELLELAGVGVDSSNLQPKLRLIDGGPLMGELVDLEDYAIKKTTNGLLVVRAELLEVRAKAYPKETQTQAAPPPAIVNLEGEIHRVKLDLRPYPGGPAARPLVREGQRVERGEPVAEPEEEPAVALHASIGGTVVEVGEDYIAIEA